MEIKQCKAGRKELECKMAVVGSNTPFVLRLVSCCVAAANKAGNIIRSVLQNGDLAVVDKVKLLEAIMNCKSWFNIYTSGHLVCQSIENEEPPL